MKQRIRPRADGSNLRLAADIGGTFTDIAVFDERTGKLTFGKALSTPHRLVEGINAGVEKAGSGYQSAGLFLHGSTIAINTILERKGAKTALLITEGFRDIYEIGRINRPDAYNLYFRKHEPLVERALRFEVKERVLSDGEIETPLDDAEIASFGRMLDGLGVEATAILFLNCYARHDHEARAKAILEKNHPNMFVSASHELSEEYREFERCSTVVANAYVGPIVRALYRRDRGPHPQRRLRRLVPDRAVDRRASTTREQAQEPLRAHAGIGPRRRRDRHAGALPRARHRERDRLRHGRHHREGRCHPQGRSAHHRRCADRRLRSGAAGADRDDGHFRGRHRRRVDRAGGGGRPAGRAAKRGRRAGPGLLWPRRRASRR